MLIEQIASDEILDRAYEWMCQKRAHHHFNSDVWQVRRWWDEKKTILQGQLRSGTYQFRELRLIRGEEQFIEYWSSLDALVLKAIAIVLTEHLKPHLSAQVALLGGVRGGFGGKWGNEGCCAGGGDEFAGASVCVSD